MSVRVYDSETDDYVILVWRAERRDGNKRGDKLTNSSGFLNKHVTRVVKGRVRFEIAGRDPQVLGPGDEIIIPVPRVAYSVIGVEYPIEVHCFYPKAKSGAVDEIDHIRTRDGSDRTLTLDKVEEEEPVTPRGRAQ